MDITTKNEFRVLKWLQINILAIMAGIIGGLSAIVFKSMITFNHHLFYDIIRPNLSANNLIIIIIPAIGALISGIIINKYSIESKGHGIPNVMMAIEINKSMIRKRVAFIKAITSSITIGSGGSAGSEGPIAQIGSSIGSMVGQVFNLSERKTRLLTVAGLSAGIAATFNAPLGGAIFGLELLLYTFNVIDIMPIMLASVVGTAVTAQYYGYEPILGKILFSFNPSELPLYMLLGLVAGIGSVIFIKFFYFLEDRFTTLKMPESIKPMLGALVTGLVGFSLIEYGIYGIGYEGIIQALNGSITFKLFLILFAAKIIATSFTVGSGGSGGVFAPSLYIGAMLGGAFGYTFHAIFPGLVTQPMAYVLLGMGAFFASVGKAPLTCIIMIPEISGDWAMIAPLMTAVIISYATSSLFLGKSSIYTIKLERLGLKRQSKHYIKDFHKTKVKDIMTEERLITVSPDMPVEKVYEFIIQHKKLRYPVTENGNISGILTFHDYKSLANITKELKVRDIMKTANIVPPNLTIDEVFDIFSSTNIGSVLVAENGRLMGIVTKTDLLRAYKNVKASSDDEDKYKLEMNWMINELEKYTKIELSRMMNLEKEIMAKFKSKKNKKQKESH
ncbi:MAG: chloride channel protein [archaeon]